MVAQRAGEDGLSDELSTWEAGRSSLFGKGDRKSISSDLKSDEWRVARKEADIMKYGLFLYCLVFATPLAFAQKPKTPKGSVSDNETAVKVAEAALIPVYG